MANHPSTSQPAVPDLAVIEQIIALMKSPEIQKSAKAIISATDAPPAQTYLNLLRERCKFAGSEYR